MILSQTKIFNIFPSAIQLGNVLKILTNNCERDTIKYIPSRDLWINCLCFAIANDKKYSCLTIDCTKVGPAKYRTEAENNNENTCYYAQKKNDRLYNRFSARNLNEDVNDLTFTIDRMTKTLEKTRQKPYETNDNLLTDVKNGHGRETKSNERTDKGNGRGETKGRKRPRFLLL